MIRKMTTHQTRKATKTSPENQPYIPSSANLPEVTLKAFVLSVILAVVLGAANNYTGATTIQGNYVVSLAGYAATNSQYNSISVANNNAPAPVLQSTTLSVAKLADGDSSLGNAGAAASNPAPTNSPASARPAAIIAGRRMSRSVLNDPPLEKLCEFVRDQS